MRSSELCNKEMLASVVIVAQMSRELEVQVVRLRTAFPVPPQQLLSTSGDYFCRFDVDCS